jgi:hypothetical protein
MAKSFAETHPHNPNATCECEHWQSCIDCHPTAHGEKYMTDAMRVRQAVAQAVLQEPVEYQYRTRPDWITEWNGWNICSKESAEAYEKTPYLHDWHYEVRRLYTTPSQRTWVSLTNEEIDSYFENHGWSPSKDYYPVIKAIEAKLKQLNDYAEEKNN